MGQGQYEARRRRPQGPEDQGEPPRRPRRRKRRRRSPVLPVLLVLVVVILAGAFGARAYYTGEVEGTRRPEGEVEVEIPQGAGTARIASILEEAGAIGNTYLFRYWSNKTGADGTYQYGTFTLDPREGSVSQRVACQAAESSAP